MLKQRASMGYKKQRVCSLRALTGLCLYWSDTCSRLYCGIFMAKKWGYKVNIRGDQEDKNGLDLVNIAHEMKKLFKK